MNLKSLKKEITLECTNMLFYRMHGDRGAERIRSMIDVTNAIGAYLQESGEENIHELFDFITCLDDEHFFDMLSALKNYYSSFLEKYIYYLKKTAYVG